MLVFDMHHIISDGVSMDVLVREFVALYQGATLPELRIQYKEYAAWQNKLLLSDAMKKQEAYWLDVFGDEVPVLDLPTDTTRPSHRDAAGSTHAFRLDETLTQALKELASETGTTLYMVLMAAYQILLARYAGQEDIVVGSPIAGRSHADLEGLIGVFINSLAIRNRPVGEKSFAAYLEEVRHTTIQAFENADYPFEMLVDQLQLQRDLSRHPLFDVMFMMQQTNETALELEGLSIRPYDAKHTQAKFDLSLHAGEVDGAIECAMQFRTSLFQPETVARMSAHLVNILQAVVAQRDVLLQDISLLSVAEWDEVIYGFNQTDTDVPTDKLIHELFEAQVAAAPQRVAVVHQGHLLTYAELNEKANQLARVLRTNGVQAESVVALVLDRSPEMIISILAALKAGGAFLPIDPSNPPERIEWILQDSGAHLLLTQSHLEQVKQLPIQRIETDDSDLYSGDGSNLELAGTPSQLCYVIYTSGSTGQPKGVQIEHCSIVNYTVCLIERMGITEQDVTLLLVSYAFDMGYTNVWNAFLTGACLHLIPDEIAKDPNELVAYAGQQRLTFVKMTPSYFQALLHSPNFAQPHLLDSLRVLMIGGEEFRPGDVMQFRQSYPHVQVLNHYGPTETTIGSVSMTVTDERLPQMFENVSIGRPHANTQVYVLNDRMQPQPIGVMGELCIGGVGVARGYLNRPELSAEKFIENPFVAGERVYRTGDKARWLPDGTIHLVGRFDFQVKIRGYRVELGEVEAMIRSYEGIEGAIVLAKEDANGFKYLCAYVVGDDELTSDTLRQYLSARLPEYMVPSALVRIASIPMHRNGKVNVALLPEPSERLSTQGEQVAPTE
ncbi:MAG: non-ribosomal peptide synthetase, partial [Tumebacillaceae bacterium]